MANINNKIQIGSEVVASLDSNEVMYDAETSVHDKIDEVNASLNGLNSNNNELATTIGDISTRLVALESKFSNYQPVDSQSGSYTIGSIAPDGGHHVDTVITFNPAFGTIPTVTARITTDHKYAYISVENVTQGSCVIKVTNGHSTQTYKSIGVSWSAVANA